MNLVTATNIMNKIREQFPHVKVQIRGMKEYSVGVYLEPGNGYFSIDTEDQWEFLQRALRVLVQK